MDVRVKLYVTRWVLARGILVMPARLGRRQGSRGALKDWYSLDTGKWDRYRRHWVCIGKDAFLTLPEAQSAARVAFEEAARDAGARYLQLKQGLDSIDSLRVHDLTGSGDHSISDLHAFDEEYGQHH